MHENDIISAPSHVVNSKYYKAIEALAIIGIGAKHLDLGKVLVILVQ